MIEAGPSLRLDRRNGGARDDARDPPPRSRSHRPCLPRASFVAAALSRVSAANFSATCASTFAGSSHAHCLFAARLFRQVGLSHEHATEIRPFAFVLDRDQHGLCRLRPKAVGQIEGWARSIALRLLPVPSKVEAAARSSSRPCRRTGRPSRALRPVTLRAIRG